MTSVLVVDDNDRNLKLALDVLGAAGFRTFGAETAARGIALAREHVPDVILMDLALPGLDGWEATRLLKASHRTSGIPIVALTGHALSGHERSARMAGCDAFLSKPCPPDSVVDEIHRLIDGVHEPSNC